MKRLCVLIYLMFPLHCLAQVTVKEIKEEHPRNKGSYYSFPKIILENRSVAGGINHDLIRDFLDIEPTKVKKSIFENVWGDKDNISRLEGIEYKVILNSPRLLCLSLSADGCGAYCEYFTNYYSYDLKTGIRIRLADILTIDGQKFVLDSMKAGKNTEITNHIALIRDSLKSERILSNTEDKEWYEQAQEMYDYCLQNSREYEPQLEYMKFYITEEELHVISERCSSHALRAVDELDEFRFVFEWKRMERFFTPEFRRILTH